jgi:hypothetical protein
MAAMTIRYQHAKATDARCMGQKSQPCGGAVAHHRMWLNVDDARAV